MRSRPRCRSETSPAVASTSRCLVMAWRVTADPAVRRVIERGPSELSRATSASRVSSPRAANTGAVRETSRQPALCLDISRDVRDLLSPSRVVHPERLGTPCCRNVIEARLDHCELGAFRDLLELEFDERGGLLRVVRSGFDRVWMPAVREPALGIHPLDGELDVHVLIARRGDLAPNSGARRKCAVKLDAKPDAELLGVGKRAPDARAGCTKKDLFLDTV